MAKNPHKTPKKSKKILSPEVTVSKTPLKAKRSTAKSTETAVTNKLPSSWRIARRAVRVLLDNWKLFLGITVIYTLLTITLVQGFAASGNVTELKSLLEEGFGGQLGKLAGGAGVFMLLIASSGNSSNDVAGVYQSFLTVIASLAIIWALRQVLAGHTVVRIRDAYYKGMYPLVPVFLVLLTIILQCIPFVISAIVYSTIISSGIASSAVESVFWGLLLVIGSALTIYMLTSSIMALYIAALPDMTPVKALRSAFGLVRGRRWSVVRKLILLPILLITGAAVVLLPVIYLVTTLAPWVFFLLTMIGLPVIHAYLYTLYRELLV